VNDALAIYFLEATVAFVARWCVAQRVEIVDGMYRVRNGIQRIDSALGARRLTTEDARP
jgi:hypothetical protein